MPLPKPSDKESEKDFINRCMSDDIMLKEYKNQKQRAAVCYTQLKQAIKNKGEAKWSDFRKGDILNLI
tara:strand:- start:580 stop:783 length:204 start_codon:yes stop_codon:yes gene_type:complete